MYEFKKHVFTSSGHPPSWSGTSTDTPRLWFSSVYRSWFTICLSLNHPGLWFTSAQTILVNNLPRFICPGLGFASTDLPWFYVLPQLIGLWFISIFHLDLWLASTNLPWFTIFLTCLVYDWSQFIYLGYNLSHLILPLMITPSHSPWFMIWLNWTQSITVDDLPHLLC
jgi:hypothetical protein